MFKAAQLVKATCWLLDTWVEKRSQQVSLRSSTSLKHKTVATCVTQGKQGLRVAYTRIEATATYWLLKFGIQRTTHEVAKVA